jgi:hypothetical protein
MATKIALGGHWSDARSWQDGMIPVSDNSVSVEIAPGVQSVADIGQHGANQPFNMKALSFKPGSAEASALAVDVTNAFASDTPFLRIESLSGGASGNKNEVSIGAHIAFPSGDIPHETAVLEITGNAINTHFTLTGGSSYHDVGAGEIDIGHRFSGSSFTFDGSGFEDTLKLEHPPLAFIYNEINVTAFPSPGALASGSGLEKIELGGVHFDRADFIPYGPQNAGGTTEAGAVLLIEHSLPVYALLNVNAVGYGGPINGHFSVGTDPQSHLDYIQYSR